MVPDPVCETIPRVEEPSDEEPPQAVPGLLQLKYEGEDQKPAEPAKVMAINGPDPKVLHRREKQREYGEKRNYLTQDELREFIRIRQFCGRDYKKMSQILKKNIWTLKSTDNLYRQGLIKIE